MMSNKTWIISLVTLSVIGMVTAAQGHMLWMEASNYSPQAGEKVTIEIGFGHKYPHNEAVKEDNIERIFIRDPLGHELPIERVSPAKYRFSPKAEGQYEAIVKLKPGYISQTTDGRKRGTKKTVPNVVSCFHFEMNAKTLITVGSKSGSSSQPSDLPLEIIFPENINGLKIGDELPMKVTYQGKPVSGAKIKATDENTALQQEGTWVFESESDAQGMVRMKMTSKGPWLINANYEIPFTDQSECDKDSYRLSLTFSLK